jgi:hypothetical protein
MQHWRVSNVNPGPVDMAQAKPSGHDPMSDTPTSDRIKIIRWVALGVLAWGVFHAIGAWRFNNNPLRAVVVLACVAAFLGFWMAMLAVRQRRLSK